VFTALDPLENLNRYQYVGANPTNWIDPGGLNVLTSEFNIITYGGYYGLGEVMLLKRGASNAILETPTSLSIFAPPPGVNDPTADYTPIPPIPMSSPITGFSYYAPPSVSFPGWQLYGRPQYSFANYEQDTSFSDASAGLKQIVQTFAEQSGIRIARIIPADINENRVKFIGSERVEFLANSIEICAGAVDPAVPSGSAAQVPEIGNIWEDETGGSQSIGTAKDTGPALGGRSGPGNAPVVSVAAVGGVVALGTANTAMCSFQAPHNLNLMKEILNRRTGITEMRIQRLETSKSPHQLSCNCSLMHVSHDPVCSLQNMLPDSDSDHLHRSILYSHHFFEVIDLSGGSHKFVMRAYVGGGRLLPLGQPLRITWDERSLSAATLG
jgi:hypothetical protein